jgi:rare lipoprotein A
MNFSIILHKKNRMNTLFKYSFLFPLIIFSACSSAKRFTNDDNSSQANIRYRNFTKESKSLEITIGTASYYGKEFHGKKTSSGEEYNMYELTAAHKTYPLGSEIRLTNIENNKSVVVRINDRMPTYNKRMIDISYGAARELGMLKSGIAKVIVEVLKWGKEK